MKITGAERQIDDICDSPNENGGTFFKEPCRYCQVGIGSQSDCSNNWRGSWIFQIKKQAQKMRNLEVELGRR